MSAAAIVGYALVADSDTVVVVAAIAGAAVSAIGGIVQTVLTNSSANKRHRRELEYRGGRKSSIAGPLFFIAIALVIVALFVSSRPNGEETVADANVASSDPVTTVSPETAPAPVSVATSTSTPAANDPSAAPACAAFTVQIAAIPKTSTARAEFEAQAKLLAQTLASLGELHSENGDACGAPNYIQFYFGPFPNEIATRGACFDIGRILHDNRDKYTKFLNAAGEIAYPYYRIEPGVSVRGTDNETLLCEPV